MNSRLTLWAVAKSAMAVLSEDDGSLNAYLCYHLILYLLERDDFAECFRWLSLMRVMNPRYVEVAVPQYQTLLHVEAFDKHSISV